MKDILTTFLFVFTVTISIAQKQGQQLIDSLKSDLLLAVDDTNKVLLLGKLSYQNRNFDTENGISYGKQSLDLAEKLKWNKGIASALNDMGTNYAIRGNYTKALEYFIKAYNKFAAINNQSMVAALANNIGWIYMNINEPDQANAYYNKALSINIKLKDKSGQSLNYGNLGIMFSSKTQYIEGIRYFEKALEIHQQLNDKDGIARDYINISNNKLFMKEYCESQAFGFKALSISSEIKSVYNQANSHKIIGDCFLTLCSDSVIIPAGCQFFTTSKKENLLLAKQHLDAAMILFEELNNLPSVSETALSISRVYEKLGDSRNALAYYKKFASNNDSVFTASNSIKIANLEKDNEIMQRDNEISIKTLEIKNKNSDLLLQVIITISIIIAALLLTIFLLKRHKYQKEINSVLASNNIELTELNVTKDKFFSIIAHDLRGPFSGFLELTSVMAQGTSIMTMDEIKHGALIMNKSAVNLFSLLGNLLEWSRMQRGLTAFEPATFLLNHKMNENIIQAQDSATKKAITFKTFIPDNLKVNADENMLACIIRNLVTNAVKFTPNGGNISISATALNNNFAEISISDSGIGMSRDLIENLFILDINTSRKGTDGELSSGLGLMICKDFIEKHGGELIVESEIGKGSTFRFTVPAIAYKEGKV